MATREEGLNGAPPDSRVVKMLLKQLKEFAGAHPNLSAALLDDGESRVWVVRISGCDAPHDGEFFFKLIVPNEFPHKPPRFRFITPNGVFLTGMWICISVGEYHAGDKPGATGSHGWRPALGMKGFALEALNGFMNFDGEIHGIGIAIKPRAERAALAAASRDWNRRHAAEVVARFAMD